MNNKDQQAEEAYNALVNIRDQRRKAIAEYVAKNPKPKKKKDKKC